MTTANPKSATALGRPPIPHEHGAWVMLYAPMIIALAARPSQNWLSIVCLFVAVTGVFLSRNVVGLIFRKRSTIADRRWLAIYLIATTLTSIPLLTSNRLSALVTVVVIAAGLFGIHSLLLTIPARKRLDRSQWGEVLAVGALTLTAPATCIVAGYSFDPVAVCLWTACALYFSSSIFFVKMLLAAVKVRDNFDLSRRLAIGRDNLIYHIGLTLIVVFIAVHLGGRLGLLSAIAYLPVILRAFVGWVRLSPKLPPLKRVGVMETIYAVWFTVFTIVSIRIAGS